MDDAPRIDAINIVREAKGCGLSKAQLYELLALAWDHEDEIRARRRVLEQVYERIVGEGCPFVSAQLRQPFDDPWMEIIIDIDEGIGYRLTVERDPDLDLDPSE